MFETTQSTPPRILVIPRQLEGFFYKRLMSEFSGRNDVSVIVDRRVHERRSPDATQSFASLNDRRLRERRSSSPVWSLPDMPFVAS